MFLIQFEETIGGLALGGGDPICDLLCFVLGLRGVPGGQRAISGPFIEYFCDISYSQGIAFMSLRGVHHRRRTRRSPGFGITKMCCLLSFHRLLRPANGWTDSGTRNDRAANVLRRITCNIGLLQTQLKSDPVLLKETPLHKGATRLTRR